jgi:glycosyltransferase involved in cell wall biosynthesis
MKILYFSPHPHINMAAPSGPGTHIREVIEGFESEGHEVIRLIAGGEELNATPSIQYKRRSWKQFIPSIVWETLRDVNMVRADKQIEKQLAQLIAREQPDMIYERSCYGMGAGLRASSAAGIRYVVEMNAPYPEEKEAMQGKSLLSFLGRRHEKMQVENAWRTVVVSSAMKEYLLKKTNVDSKKIIIVPNAVNPAHVKVNPENELAIREQYGLKSEHLVFGFVGSIFPYHGVDRMIDSFEKLEKKHPAIRMLIVGDGEVLPALKARVHALQLSDKIHFTGNVPHRNVYDYLSIMDIAVMAKSNWYGSPVKIFEYGAMQRAIIAPDVVPVRDVMIDCTHGLLIDEDSNSLLHAMSYMIEHPAERLRMAGTFHDKVMNEHTWQKMAKHILEHCE